MPCGNMRSLPLMFGEASGSGSPPWVGTIIWAVVLLVFLMLFRRPITKLIESLAEFSFKANSSGVEASFKKQQSEASALIVAATESRPPSADNPPADAREIAKTVERAAPQSEARRFSNASILWVDDRPNNNIYERKAFQAIGLQFTLALSTDEALLILRNQRFAVIISDMGRPPDPRAGYTLLKALRDSGDKTPFVIYAGSNAPEHKREAEQKGGQGSTNDPRELFALVTRLIIQNTDTGP